LYIRGGETPDVEVIRKLLLDAVLPASGISLDSGTYFVASEGGRLVGAIGLQRAGSSMLLRSAVVAPDWRNRGVGSLLARTALEHARKDQPQSLFLLTTTAAGFFARLGFRAIDRTEAPPAIRQTPEYRTLCPSTATLMRSEM
jgi:amino-acid N-acetyltransferase